MKIKDFENHNWKENDRIYVVVNTLIGDVSVPVGIEEKHYLEHPAYYQYIYDKVFLTMEDARNGFVEECMRTRRTIKRKETSELKKIDTIREYINQLKGIETEVKAKQVEYGV